MINMISGENAEEESSGGSDEVMETASERLQTYLNSEMCDLWDSEEWSVLHFDFVNRLHRKMTLKESSRWNSKFFNP